MAQKKFYITTPIYYVNAEPHIGHTYCTIATDILARFHRAKKEKTFFLTGTDEHGAKIEEYAKNAGLKPKQFADRISKQFKKAWKELGISNDNFIRTTDLAHKKAVQKALQYMYDKGDIYKGYYEGLYCRGCEQYKGEKDLIDGMCSDHKVRPEKMREDCYMFRQSKYQEKIYQLIKTDKIQILPVEKKNAVLSFYENEKLHDVSFSRRNVKWGIPIPWDPEHTTYVWADAFLNYLTGLGWKGPKSKLPKMWPADLHLMSKDILRVHATIWPAMLLSLDLPLFKTIFVHGFFLVEGQKMSKSLKNVISPGDLIEKYGVDATRYLLMSATPFGNDSDISWAKFDEKYNSELANGLGNFTARVLTLASRFKKLPTFKKGKEIKEKINNIEKEIGQKMEEFKIQEALVSLWELIKFGDNYVNQVKPWENTENKKEELVNLVIILSEVANLLKPFLPQTSKEILKNIKTTKKFISVKKSKILFPRLN